MCASAILDGASDALRAHARRTCLDGQMRSANINFHSLQIRQPAASRFVHCVADIVAGFRPLATHVTALRHFRSIPSD
jgi:hypothetical protein